MNLETDRLILRPWKEEDRQSFAEMSADPAVMEHLLPLNGRDAADGWIDRQIAHLNEHGFCFWALEAIAVGTLIAERPPHRTERAQFGHSAPTSGV